MSIKNDAVILAVAAVVLLGVAYYVKKKVGAAVDAAVSTVSDPLTAMWADSARFASESWETAAPVLDTGIEHITGAPSVYVPGMSYPDYLSAANDRRDAIAGQYGPAAGPLIPSTNMTECERAKAEGRTWDASFACPAGDFISYLWK